MYGMLEKDQGYKGKYEGQKIYMQSEFLQKVENSEEIGNMLEEMFDIWEMIDMNY